MSPLFFFSFWNIDGLEAQFQDLNCYNGTCEFLYAVSFTASDLAPYHAVT